MIRSLDQLPAGRALDTAICIIGAGAAGITLACELEECGVSVTLLEAGGLHIDPVASDEYYRGTATPPHPNPSEFRRVGFGGTTKIWGGRCVPFDPIDFERRDYISESGWPIGYEEVARYYPRALEYCDAGAFDFSATGSLSRNARQTPLLPGLRANNCLIADRIERYSLPTDFGTRYRRRIARSSTVLVLTHARCLALHRSAGAPGLESVTIADRTGNRHRLRAGVFVLATGGIEVTRLLLQSDREGPGLGNHSDIVGRFYACHFENILARLVPLHGTVPFDFERTNDGVYCRRKLLLTEEAQRRHRLLNTAFRLHFPTYSDAAHGNSVLSAIYLAKSLLIPEYRNILRHGSETSANSPAREHLENILRGVPELARFAFRWLLLRNLSTRKLPYTLVSNRDGTFPLEFNCEQTPSASNRIKLINDVDRHGVARVHVEWRLSEGDADAAYRAILLLRDVLRDYSACNLEFDENTIRRAIGRSPPLGGHHIGTTRMAASEKQGVVDTHCALFEVPNLFVASSSVFCTSSHANPTLTIVALALRLADYLKRDLTARTTILHSRGETPSLAAQGPQKPRVAARDT